jgi:ABC-type sugar transport system substrate-binding protein
MKLFKKAAALFAVAALITASLAACGSSGNAPASNDTAAASTAAESAPAAAEQEAAPAAADSSAVEPAAAATETVKTKVLGVDPIKIAYVPMSTAGVVNNIVKMAFADTIDAYKDTVTIDYFDPGYDVQKQITMINDCVTQGYDVIMGELFDPVATATAVEEAEKAGIPVITCNSGTVAVHTLHIRGVDYLSGWKAAEQIAQVKDPNEPLKVVIIDFPAQMLSVALQSAGFIDYMEQNTNWELLDDRCIDNISTEGANTAVRDILTKYDQIDIIWNVGDDLTAGTIQAVKAAGRDDGSILVYGNYGLPATFDDLNSPDGILYGLTFCDYYTEYSTAMSYALYHAVTGATAVSMGLDATPELAFSVFPITREDAKEYAVLSRWQKSLDWNAANG